MPSAVALLPPALWNREGTRRLFVRSACAVSWFVRLNLTQKINKSKGDDCCGKRKRLLQRGSQFPSDMISTKMIEHAAFVGGARCVAPSIFARMIFRRMIPGSVADAFFSSWLLCSPGVTSVRVVRAFLIEEQKIVKKVLLEKQKKKKA